MRIISRLGGLDKAIRTLTAKRVLVGIPAETALRRPEPGEAREPMNNAGIGYIMEYGAPAAGIPPRPFLHPGIASVQDRLNKRLEVTAKAILDGKSVDVDAALTAVGLIAQAGVRAKITDGPFIPLKPATIAARKRRGFKGEKPLIETGQLRASINFVIRPAGGDNA